jgi:hypothetical protein
VKPPACAGGRAPRRPERRARPAQQLVVLGHGQRGVLLARVKRVNEKAKIPFDRITEALDLTP